MNQLRAIEANESRSLDFDADVWEKRSVQMDSIELDTEATSFSGYAAVFDREADLGEFTESVSRGAFRKALSSGPNVPMFYDHDPQWGPLATTGAGTLSLREDERGLRVEAKVNPDHLMYPTLRSQMERGEIRGMSFGFIAGQGNSRVENRGGRVHRTITGFKAILDVSPTWIPAYQGTSAELRHALAEARSTLPQQILSGTYLQLEDGAEKDTDTGTGGGTTRSMSVTIEGDVSGLVEERSSGVSDDFDEVAAAARGRRLHMLGLTLPR